MKKKFTFTLTLKKLLFDLKKLKNAEKAKNYARFFKTEKGEYGYGDKFLGITVPDQRKIVKKYYQDISLKDVRLLLQSPFHEERLVALLALVEKYKKANDEKKKEIFKLYFSNLHRVNNWDLVDVTCRDIVGAYLYDKNRKLLYRLAASKNLWKRRVAVISTFYFIAKNDFQDSLKIAKLLLKDKHDLIHKAVGWMLREVGKRSLLAEKKFLDKHAAVMPRTMLRYAIEKFAEKERKSYLARERLVKSLSFR